MEVADQNNNMSKEEKVKEIIGRVEDSAPELSLLKELPAGKGSSSAQDFAKIRYEDIFWRVIARKRIGWTLVILLIVQNAFVFGLTAWAFYSGQLADLQIIFGILIPATLGETAYMVKTIVSWLFRDIEYPNN